MKKKVGKKLIVYSQIKKLKKNIKRKIGLTIMKINIMPRKPCKLQM
jgi:hypothetical protein